MCPILFSIQVDLCEEYLKSPESWSNSPANFINACIFDGPDTMSQGDVQQIKKEMVELQREKVMEKERRERAARARAGYSQEQHNFHSSYADAQRNRDRWYNQESNSRHWDSFNSGPGSKRSPKQKNKSRSQNRADPGHGSQSNGYGARAQSNTAPAGTHYGVLGVTIGASEAEIKKAYRKVRKWSCDSGCILNSPLCPTDSPT